MIVPWQLEAPVSQQNQMGSSLYPRRRLTLGDFFRTSGRSYSEAAGQTGSSQMGSDALETTGNKRLEFKRPLMKGWLSALEKCLQMETKYLSGRCSAGSLE